MDESNLLDKSIMPSEEGSPAEEPERKKEEFLKDIGNASLDAIGIPSEEADEERAAAAARREELTDRAKMEDLRTKINWTPDGEEELLDGEDKMEESI